MVDEYRPRPARDKPAESDFIDRLSGFLHEQGALDETDIRNLRSWLARGPESLEDDWSELLEDLISQGEYELVEEIRGRIGSDPDQEIQDFLSRQRPEENWAFLLGAGASRPPPTDIPTVQELLPRLWTKAEEINAPSLLALEKRCQDLGITNIEDLLTAISLAQDAASRPAIASLVGDLLFPQPTYSTGPQRKVRLVGSELVDSLGESSQLLFSVLVGMMKDQKQNAIHDAVARRVQQKPGRIITTNYDVCVERALGEGFYRYGLEDEPQNGINDADKTLVLKLHGSLSWYVCRSCDTPVSATLKQLDAASASSLYPVVAMCGVCAATAQQLIVAPVGAKSADHPVLLEIRQQAEEAFRNAPVIVVVGYSFSEADHYITRMIARAVRHDPKKIILLFDREGAPHGRLRKFLRAHTRDTAYETEHQLISIKGLAEQTVPLLVQRLAEERPVPAAATDGNGSQPGAPAMPNSEQTLGS